MSTFMTYAFCNHCPGTHPSGIAIGDDKGRFRQSRLNDPTDGQPLPEDLASLRNNAFQCPTTGKMYLQKNNDQVFLVRVA